MSITRDSLFGVISSKFLFKFSLLLSNSCIFDFILSNSICFLFTIFSSSAIFSFLPITPPLLEALFPPVILPVCAISSPDKVTILNEFFNFLDKEIALSILSTTTVLANANFIAFSYFLS